ncbi:DUF4038 domain-containing protein [Lactococcus fujiensis]|uniref:Apiosidase-like catalytic domain-containing protein n=1 Tax=Lactococcus fujiensis JCM 16395 TaxID=1291764 RepID=A0A2A5RQ31_9LACT|nr:DUF4038 domain-containing protein [Lactococcus fujiensis]PCS01560.1 hypothetical protein RT41_GL000324 [Lactococcus fujiensis JCM 16395]
MSNITISKNKRTLLKDNKPFFYLADTCWSAFTNIDEKEWISYLSRRKKQGFNTIQINVLPQWDRSINNFQILPFSIKDGIIDFEKFDDQYFLRANKLCRIADQMGFTLSLVLLWANYVKGTWASALDKEKNIFPEYLLDNYFDKVLKYFDEFNPIYVIGGDTDFPTSETIHTYQIAFSYFKKYSPQTLKTIHIKGRLDEIPEVIIESSDLYFYQSGHNNSFPEMPFYLATSFYMRFPPKPIINSEPCYEQMGYSRKVYGRFKQFDVRKAAWQSLLSGACAGITYGAHGIWSWHDYTSSYNDEIGEAFDRPLTWQEALSLPGALDYCFLKNLFKILNVNNLVPKNTLLIDGDDSIRIASTEENDLFIIYIPSSTVIQLGIDFSEYSFQMLDLDEKFFYQPEVKFNKGGTELSVIGVKQDALVIARKN